MNRVAPLALALALGACSLFGSDEPRACPRIGIIGDAAELTRYRAGDARDITDQLYTAQIADAIGTCRFDRASANVELRVALVAERGAAMTDQVAEIEYFVAVTGPEDDILAKENFRTALDFAGRNRAGVAEELTQRIPMPEDADASRYSVLVGFQLTADELEENRRRR
jgi:hypothetical protein